MKIAITAQGQDLSSQVDPRFGRAQYFLIVNTESMDFECVANKQNINAPSGAGIQAGQIIANTGAKVLLTGNCGPKALGILSAAKVQVIVGVSGKVEDVIQKYNNGELNVTDSSNVEGHWM